jgi:hypothetical protein
MDFLYYCKNTWTAVCLITPTFTQDTFPAGDNFCTQETAAHDEANK